MEENKIVDGSSVVSKKEAKKLLKETGNKITNKKVDSFVSLKDINKIYPNGVQAVFNFNLDIDKHDFIVLVGPSGCGKSTTLRMVAGLEDITSGYLYIDKVLSNYLESKSRDISMVFQSYALYPQMTVYDNIAFPLKVRKYLKPVINKVLERDQNIINLLKNNFEAVKEGLIDCQYIGGDKGIKIHYLAKKLNTPNSVATYLLSKTNIFVDELDLNKKKLIKEAEEKIKAKEALNIKNHVELNENYEILFDLNTKKEYATKLQADTQIKDLLSNRLHETIEALNFVLNPERKIANKLKELEEILKINLDAASRIFDNRVILFKNEKDKIDRLISELDESIHNEETRLENEHVRLGDNFEILKDGESEVTLNVDTVLKTNHELIDALTNHYECLKTKLISKEEITKLDATNIELLKKYQAISDEDIKANVEVEIVDLEGEVEREKVSLKSKGLEVNDKFEVIKNGTVIVRKTKLTKDEIRDKVFAAANILDLGPYLDRRPKELSGGQMQRVALGRAIVRNAKLFLMDEPLSNLDAKLRVAMRSEIVRLHEKIGATTIYVTHDQTEAMTMATKIVVMSKGWIQQVGKPQDVYNNPNNLFVATFIGSPAMNIVSGKVNGNKITFANGFKLDMGKDFSKKHQDFYNAKIAECERMLKTLDNHIEIECIEILKETKKLYDNIRKNYLAIKNDLNIVHEKLEALDKVSAPMILESVEQAISFLDDEKTSNKQKVQTFNIMLSMIENYETINKADIAKIHSAQAFSKEIVETNNEIHFDSKGKRFLDSINIVKKMKKKREIKEIKKQAFSVEIGDPKEYIMQLKEAYINALNGEHEIKIGIRPENIHLASEFEKKTASDKFDVNVDVVELMGNESFLHTSWNDTDFVAKITSGTIVEAHSNINLVFDTEKIHIFDINSGETIL